MSFSYSRVTPEATPLKLYGFNKVSGGELKSIIMRMQKHTHSTEPCLKDGKLAYTKRPFPPPRPQSGFCRKVALSETDGWPERNGSGSRRLTPKMAERVARRLQKPTMSKMAARGLITPHYELTAEMAQETRSFSQEEQQKAIQRLTRPTTATKSKTFCMYCLDPELDDYWDRDYSDDRQVSREAMDDIINRMRSPVCQDAGRCRKRKQSVHINRDELPLISGLDRSRNVEEIVARLHGRPAHSATNGTQGDGDSRETNPRMASGRRTPAATTRRSGSERK